MSADASLLRARSLLDAGRFEEAAGEFAQVFEHAPREGDVRVLALRGRAAALHALGRSGEALGCLEQAQWACPGDPGVLDDVARVVLEIDLDGLVGAQRLDALRTLDGVAAALRRRRRPESAEAICDRILEHRPADEKLLGRVCATKGGALHELGRDLEAIEWLDRALQHDPDNRQIAELRAAAAAGVARLGRG